MSAFRRLYRGETNIDFIGARRRWYLVSAVLIVLCIASMAFRGFHFGIDFEGGSSFQADTVSSVSIEKVEKAVEDAGVNVETAQVTGRGSSQGYLLKTAKLEPAANLKVRTAIAATLKTDVKKVSGSTVSPAWGGEVTKQALIGLIAFLVLVSIYLWIRYEQKMAIAALLALVHDLVLTAGVYSMIGFEVTPSTIVGLLTILGFSLYDTVVVFDKVAEDTRGILGGVRFTYAEAANNAVNETLMRSINTSLISLLPVGGLLFVGAGLLGVGTLKDLALVLFVGLMTGAYSSLFLATPWLVDLKEREPRYQALKQRVAAKRASVANAARNVVEAVSMDKGEPAVAGVSSGAGVGTTRVQPRKRATPTKSGRPSGKKKR